MKLIIIFEFPPSGDNHRRNPRENENKSPDSSLQNVHRNICAGEKPEICQWCGKGFNAKKTLRNHERLHTGMCRHYF